LILEVGRGANLLSFLTSYLRYCVATGGKAEKQSGTTGPTVPGVNDGDPLGRKTVPDIYGLAVFRGGRMVGVVSSTESTCTPL
jgi:hypothetical protein